MSNPYFEILNARVAGSAAALFLLVGRWSPERLLGIETERYFELNLPMLLEPRHWVLPILLITVILLKFRRRRSTTKQERAISNYGRSALKYLILLFLYLICSVAWTPVLSFGLLKAYDTITTFGVIMVICLWSISTDAELFHRAFWKSLVFLTGIILFCALISLGTGRLAVLGGGPNIFARLMFLFAAGCMGLSQRRNVIQLLFVMTAIALVVLSGSRGGMLASAVGGIVYIWIENTKITSKFLLVSGGMVTGVMLLFFTPLGNRVYETFSHRIVKLTLRDNYTSDRDVLLDEAIRIWKEHPIFGTGIAGWANEQQGGTAISASYPHNLFSEMLCEGGLVAACLLGMAILKFIQFSLHLRWRLHVPSFACATMFLTASQFTGDFFDSRGIFICAMLTTFPCSARAMKGTADSTLRRKSMNGLRHTPVPFAKFV